MNDYEEGMRACFDAAKSWMAVSSTGLFLFLVAMLVASHTLGGWNACMCALLVAMAREI